MGAETWTPLDLSSATGTDRENHYLQVIGRVKADTSISQAQADLQALADRLALQLPNTNGGHGIRVVRLVEDLTFGTRQFVIRIDGRCCVLCCCWRASTLPICSWLVSPARQKEMAIRIGMGANRWQLIRQMLMESVLLSLAGAGAGVLVGYVGNEICSRRSIPPFIVAHVAGLKHHRD